MASIIQDTFEATILLRLFPRSQVDIFVQILQSDGGVLPAAINAATLACIDAGIPMVDFVCACSSGLVEGEPILGMQRSGERLPF
jgi:exosome complex component RRP41